jgi:hypothetical protein
MSRLNSFFTILSLHQLPLLLRHPSTNIISMIMILSCIFWEHDLQPQVKAQREQRKRGRGRKQPTKNN